MTAPRIMPWCALVLVILMCQHAATRNCSVVRLDQAEPQVLELSSIKENNTNKNKEMVLESELNHILPSGSQLWRLILSLRKMSTDSEVARIEFIHTPEQPNKHKMYISSDTCDPFPLNTTSTTFRSLKIKFKPSRIIVFETIAGQFEIANCGTSPLLTNISDLELKATCANINCGSLTSKCWTALDTECFVSKMSEEMLVKLAIKMLLITTFCGVGLSWLWLSCFNISLFDYMLPPHPSSLSHSDDSDYDFPYSLEESETEIQQPTF